MPVPRGITPRRGGAATIARPFFAILFLVYLVESVCAHEAPPASRRADADGRERGSLHIVDGGFAVAERDPRKEDGVQYRRIREADVEDNGSEHYIDGRPRILSASASANGTESPVPKEPLARGIGPLLQGSAGAGGALRLFTKSAALMDEMAHALKREESLPEASDTSAAGGEYVVGLARDLHKMASFLFNVLDVTVSVADESMNALQLGNLVDTYKSLAEEGALAPIGVKASGAPL